MCLDFAGFTYLQYKDACCHERKSKSNHLNHIRDALISTTKSSVKRGSTMLLVRRRYIGNY